MKDFTTIENEFLIAEINHKGAELRRLYFKKEKREIIWNGNPEYWGRHAPVLFPFVGKVKNNQYNVDGNTYELGQHGLARNSVFSQVNSNKNSCEFELTSSTDSLKKYPFEFSLKTKFTLENTTLKTEYTVSNLGKKTMYCSIGAHPAFNCPSNNELSLKDYNLQFETKETSDILLLSETGQISDTRTSFLQNIDSLALSDGLFKNDALIFDDLKSKFMIIESNKDHLKVKVSWSNFPHMGIWKPIGAPFLCIEPWQGMADFDSHNGNFKTKFGVLSLEKEKDHSCGYDISVL